MLDTCTACFEVPKTVTWDDYRQAIEHWIRVIDLGRATVLRGDGPIHGVLVRIETEDQFVYEHQIRCECGRVHRCAVCIRSSVPIVEIVEERA